MPSVSSRRLRSPLTLHPIATVRALGRWCRIGFFVRVFNEMVNSMKWCSCSSFRVRVLLARRTSSPPGETSGETRCTSAR
jgi:hypothetical protein